MRLAYFYDDEEKVDRIGIEEGYNLSDCLYRLAEIGEGEMHYEFEGSVMKEAQHILKKYSEAVQNNFSPSAAEVMLYNRVKIFEFQDAQGSSVQLFWWIEPGDAE